MLEKPPYHKTPRPHQRIACREKQSTEHFTRAIPPGKIVDTFAFETVGQLGNLAHLKRLLFVRFAMPYQRAARRFGLGKVLAGLVLVTPFLPVSSSPTPSSSSVRYQQTKRKTRATTPGGQAAARQRYTARFTYY